MIEYRTGSDKTSTVHKLPGLTKYANIVLKRGVTQDRQLWNWRKAIEQGTADRRNGSIVLLDDKRDPSCAGTSRTAGSRSSSGRT